MSAEYVSSDVERQAWAAGRLPGKAWNITDYKRRLSTLDRDVQPLSGTADVPIDERVPDFVLFGLAQPEFVIRDVPDAVGPWSRGSYPAQRMTGSCG
jgi:hypothetical protein